MGRGLQPLPASPRKCDMLRRASEPAAHVAGFGLHLEGFGPPSLPQGVFGRKRLAAAPGGVHAAAADEIGRGWPPLPASPQKCDMLRRASEPAAHVAGFGWHLEGFGPPSLPQGVLGGSGLQPLLAADRRPGRMRRAPGSAAPVMAMRFSVRCKGTTAWGCLQHRFLFICAWWKRLRAAALTGAGRYGI